MMRRSYALGAVAAIVALAVVAAAPAMTPTQLYGKLLTTDEEFQAAKGRLLDL